jgi:hypothetical protein
MVTGIVFISCDNSTEPGNPYSHTDHRFIFMGREKSLTTVSTDEEEFTNGLNKIFNDYIANIPDLGNAVPFDGVTIIIEEKEETREITVTVNPGSEGDVAAGGLIPGVITITYTETYIARTPALKNTILLDGDIYELTNGEYIELDNCPELFKELYREKLPHQQNYDVGSCFQFTYIDIPQKGRSGVFYGYVSIVKDTEKCLEQGWAMTGNLVQQ